MAVRKLDKMQKVFLLSLSETQISKDIVHVIQDILGSRKCGWDLVPSEGASGGLTTIRDENILQVEDVKSQRLLAPKFKWCFDGILWAATKVYGPNEKSAKDSFWSTVSSSMSRWPVPWCAGGISILSDFQVRKKEVDIFLGVRKSFRSS